VAARGGRWNRHRSFTIGGTVSGLAAGDSVTLQNNGTDSLLVSCQWHVHIQDLDRCQQTLLCHGARPPLRRTQTCTASANSGTATLMSTTVVVTAPRAPSHRRNGCWSFRHRPGSAEWHRVPHNTGPPLPPSSKPHPLRQTYNVTVSTQPTGPAQTALSPVAVAHPR